MKSTIPVKDMKREVDDEWLRYNCSECDAGFVQGTIGEEPEITIKKELKKKVFTKCQCGIKLKLVGFKRKWVYSKHREYRLKVEKVKK